MNAEHPGGCLCGRIRFEAFGEPASAGSIAVSHCHCAFCRRQTGSAMATFATFRVPDRFRWTAGTPAVYRSSPNVRRRFCRHCGTPLSFEEDARPDEVDVAVGTFDRPDLLAPKAHFYTAQKIAWLHVDEHLPHHGGGEP